MKALCRHCQSSCKKIGLVECISYNAKANRPQQLQLEIREAFKSKNYELGARLQEELFRLNHG